jgi:hypothetical protein
MEIWKPTHVRNDYEVSNFGRVRRIKRAPKRYGVYSYLKPRLKRYSRIVIDYKEYSIHRLVATAFIPNPNELPLVMHKDNNPHNNHVDNLKWGNTSENTKQAYDDGLVKNHYSPFKERVSCPDCGYTTNKPSMRHHIKKCKLKKI